jgi:hypothetical protein
MPTLLTDRQTGDRKVIDHKPRLDQSLVDAAKQRIRVREELWKLREHLAMREAILMDACSCLGDVEIAELSGVARSTVARMRLKQLAAYHADQ